MRFLKMPEIKLTPGQTMAAGAAGAAAAVFLFSVFFIRPAGANIGAMEKELKTIEQEILTARNIIKIHADAEGPENLLMRKDVSRAIDTITKTGEAFDIDFVSIRPKAPQSFEGYKRLPILLELESSYDDLGLFLGVLAKLKIGVAAARGFEIQRDVKILPKILSRVEIDLYLKIEPDG
jgi:hypothetical protein